MILINIFMVTGAPNEGSDPIDAPPAELSARAMLIYELRILENLEELAKTDEGRARIRAIALDDDGVFILEEGHTLFEAVCIHHLYAGEPLMVDGQYTQYVEGMEGLSYYYSGDARHRIRLNTDTQVRVIPTDARPRRLPKSRERTNVSPGFRGKVEDSPASEHLLEAYDHSDGLGRELLDASNYTGREITGADMHTVFDTLEGAHLLDGLERHGWREGQAMVILNKTAHAPQTLLLMDIDDQGNIQSMRRYTISTGRSGISTQGEFRTPPGVARLTFHYGRAHGKDILDGNPVGTVYKDQAVQPDRITSTHGLWHGVAVMTTRIMKMNGLESTNGYMGGYYIHGTNRERFLGQPASDGCIRVSNVDILEITSLAPPEGLLVDVIPQRTPAEIAEVLQRMDAERLQ